MLDAELGERIDDRMPSGFVVNGTSLTSVSNAGSRSARGIAKSISEPDNSWPECRSQTHGSHNAWPIPCAMPPWLWPWINIGLTARPQSSIEA